MNDANYEDALNIMLSGKALHPAALAPLFLGSIFLKPFLRPFFRELREEHRQIYKRYLKKEIPSVRDPAFDAVLLH